MAKPENPEARRKRELGLSLALAASIKASKTLQEVRGIGKVLALDLAQHCQLLLYLGECRRYLFLQRQEEARRLAGSALRAEEERTRAAP